MAACLGVCAALSLLLLQPVDEPVYRLSRRAVSATAPQWDWADEVIPLSQWRCNLAPAAPAGRSVRMTDPARPERDCEWTAPEGAWVLNEGAGWFKGPYRYTLAVRLEAEGPYSLAADRETWIDAPTNVRIRPVP